MLPFNENKGIENIDDFNEYAVSIFENFLESFDMESGLIKHNLPEDECSLDCEFLYTARGTKLADRFRDRLYKIGLAHFPEEVDEIDLYTHLIQEE